MENAATSGDEAAAALEEDEDDDDDDDNIIGTAVEAVGRMRCRRTTHSTKIDTQYDWPHDVLTALDVAQPYAYRAGIVVCHALFVSDVSGVISLQGGVKGEVR